MASKGKSKPKSPSNVGVDGKSNRKGGKHTKESKATKDEDEKNSLAFKVLSSTETKELLELEAPDDVESKLCELMKTPLHVTDLKDAALLDYYVAALLWAKEQQFNPEQLSAFFTVVHSLLNNIKEKQMTIVDNIKEFKQMTMGIGAENGEVSGGLECLTVPQAKMVVDYMYKSLFQHYKIYEFMFTTKQAEEIIGTDLDVEVAPAADIPWPPPLEEAITGALYDEYVASPSALSQDGESGDDVDKTEATEAQEGEEKQAEDSTDQIEPDLLNQLNQEEIKHIINSVMEEMVQGLQTEVAQKLREKENLLLNRINKIHNVDSKK